MKSVALVMMLAGTASADPAADALAKKVQAYYSQQTHLVADLHQIVTQSAFGRVTPSEGRLWAMRPTALRADYYQNGSSKLKTRFAYDGTTFWMISFLNKEMKKIPVTGNQLPAATVFLTGGNLLATFNAALDPAGKLVLTPKQTQAYAKLVLTVDASGQVSDSLLVDPSGNSEEYQFANVDMKSGVSLADFTVDPKQYPNYKVMP